MGRGAWGWPEAAQKHEMRGTFREHRLRTRRCAVARLGRNFQVDILVSGLYSAAFMDGRTDHGKARQSDDLFRLFLERARQGDVEGVVALYEQTAVLASGGAGQLVGHDALRHFYQQLLANPPNSIGEVQPPLQRGDWALTSTRFAGGATAEVAHRQPDGTWLWVIDQPNVVAG